MFSERQDDHYTVLEGSDRLERPYTLCHFHQHPFITLDLRSVRDHQLVLGPHESGELASRLFRFKHFHSIAQPAIKHDFQI